MKMQNAKWALREKQCLWSEVSSAFAIDSLAVAVIESTAVGDAPDLLPGKGWRCTCRLPWGWGWRCQWRGECFLVKFICNLQVVVRWPRARLSFARHCQLCNGTWSDSHMCTRLNGSCTDGDGSHSHTRSCTLVHNCSSRSGSSRCREARHWRTHWCLCCRCLAFFRRIMRSGIEVRDALGWTRVNMEATFSSIQCSREKASGKRMETSLNDSLGLFFFLLSLSLSLCLFLFAWLSRPSLCMTHNAIECELMDQNIHCVLHFCFTLFCQHSLWQ